MTRTLLTKSLASLTLAGALLAGAAGTANAETVTATAPESTAMVLPWIAQSRGLVAPAPDGATAEKRRVVLVVLE